MIDGISRRGMLGFMATAAAGSLTATGAFAQSATLVAATYPGGWEEAHRKFVGPLFTKNTGAGLSLAPVQGLDQVAKIVASKGNPPYDVALLPTGPMLQALPQNVLMPFPAGKSKNLANLPEAFRRSAGPDVSLQIMGIAYNPERIKTPPTSWQALWDPRYKGRVGLCSMTSGLGTAFMLEIARMAGGDPYKMDAAFGAIRDLLPNVATIANNPSTLATLFQQGEVDIAPQFLNEVEVLRAKGVPIAFARPETGLALLASGMHIVAGTKVPDLAVAYIDAALDAEVQAKLAEAPYYLVPTNGKVPLAGSLASLAKNMDELAKNNQYDWEIVNAQRPDWINRFNREVKK